MAVTQKRSIHLRVHGTHVMFRTNPGYQKEFEKQDGCPYCGSRMKHTLLGKVKGCIEPECDNYYRYEGYEG